MADIQHIKKMITTKTRRLQKLREQQALTGINTAPEKLIEIEDIEAELEVLQVELKNLESAASVTSAASTTPTKVDLIHIHNWGQRPAKFPKEAIVLDWNGEGKFEDPLNRPRKSPDAATWRNILLPELFDLPQKISGEGLVRLEGRCALSTGFAFGHVFKVKARYRLEVAQFVPGKGIEYWAADQRPPVGSQPPQFVQRLIRRTQPAPTQEPPPQTANDGVVIVNALTKSPSTAIVRDVGSYFGETEAFGQSLSGESQFQAVKGILILEAEAATQAKRQLEDWEAASLAESSCWLLKDFIDQVKPENLHLFLAVPVGLAVFLGHYWDTIKRNVYCYEEVGGERVYAPACELWLS